MADPVVNYLNKKLQTVLEKRFFKILIGATVLMNPTALLPQVWAVLVAPSVVGIALAMWYIFAVIQTAMMFEGIRVKSSPVFWSMLISVAFSLTIIITVHLRT